MKRLREKTAIYKPRPELRNTSFPHGQQKELTLPPADFGLLDPRIGRQHISIV